MDFSPIFLIAGSLVIVFGVLALLALSRRGRESELTYQKQNHLFSAAERSFLSVLKLAVDDDKVVFGKVRVADVITPRKGGNRSRWQTAFNKISAKHFDYLICDASTLEPLIAVELNDSSHQSKKVRQRDAFLASACESAEVPLVFIEATADYQVENIRNQLFHTAPATTPSRKGKERVEPELTLQTIERCPRCDRELVQRRARHGKFKGRTFLGCSGYPDCRYSAPPAPREPSMNAAGQESGQADDQTSVAE